MRNQHFAAWLAAAAISCAVFARVLSKCGVLPTTTGLTRSLLYLLLYLAWGVPLRRRVMQPQARRRLAAIAGLMVFWFVLRTVKYFFLANDTAARLVWYGYYIPMLLIPTLAVPVALSLGKPEEFRLPRRSALLFLAAGALLLLVLSNDLHEWVFRFPAGRPHSDLNYRYAPGYFAVLGWEVLCALAALWLILTRCRFSPRRKYLPVCILACILAYCALYISGAHWLRLVLGDLAAAECLMVAALLESCLQNGMIPTNSGYLALFRAGTPQARITDASLASYAVSANAPDLPQDVLRAAVEAPVALDARTRLKSSAIPGGYVFWLEDIADISALLERLEDNRRSIAERNELDAVNYRAREQLSALREKNRLYDLLQAQTARQIARLDELLARSAADQHSETRRRLLAKAAVIAAYVKRRGNLTFLAEGAQTLDSGELRLCLEESLANLRLLGVDCALALPGGLPLEATAVIAFYERFETAVEAALDTLRAVWIHGRPTADGLRLCLELETDAAVELPDAACEREDGVSRFTQTLRRAVQA